MRRYGRVALRYAVWFFGMIAVFTAAMTLVYCIPQEKIAYKQETSAYILDMEEQGGVWFGNFFGVDSGRLDNTTDSLMMDSVLLDEGLPPLERAMSIGGYSRYWHGYQVFLRPLLTFLTYWQIRYVNMFAFFLLLCAVLLAMQRVLGGVTAMAFMASLVACYIVIVPMSLQYHSVFLVLLTASLVLLCVGRMSTCGAPLFFMVVGMVTNFVDLLTAPLLTLGIPLLLLLEMDLHDEKQMSIVSLILRLIFCSLAWGAGYALCWISKWCIGSVVLGESVFSGAGDHALMWIGNNWGKYGRLIACAQNFKAFFLAHGKRVFFPLILPAVAYLYCLARFRSRRAGRAWVLLIVCLYPYVWYPVLANHSLFHTWFTNRLQAITLFGVLLFLIEWVDWNEVLRAFDTGRRRGRAAIRRD